MNERFRNLSKPAKALTVSVVVMIVSAGLCGMQLVVLPPQTITRFPMFLGMAEICAFLVSAAVAVVSSVILIFHLVFISDDRPPKP